MQYKTIIHGLLQQQAEMCAQLRKSHQLLPALELYARELKASHEAWMEMLLQMRPSSDRGQIAGEALEMALKEMGDHLPSDSRESGDPQVLDAAMLFVRRPMSRA